LRSTPSSVHTTGLVLAVAVLPANRPEDEAAPHLVADITAQDLTIGALYIDRGYINAPVVDEVVQRLGTIVCRPWVARNGKHFSKSAFHLNMRDRTIRCPAGEVQPFVLGDDVEFPAKTCAACPLRAKCTDASLERGRSVFIAEKTSYFSTASGRALRRPQVARSSANASPSNTARPTPVGVRDERRGTAARATTSSTFAAPPPSPISNSSSTALRSRIATSSARGPRDHDGFNCSVLSREYALRRQSDGDLYAAWSLLCGGFSSPHLARLVAHARCHASRLR
jgi:hypothetical protein